MAKDQAVQRMENRLAVGDGVSGSDLTAEDLAEVKISDHFVQLAPGNWCKGRYLGLGNDVEVQDQATGEMIPKRTHRFEMLNGRGTFIIMEKAQLKQQLTTNKVGKVLLIQRATENITKGAKQIGQYTVGEVVGKS